MLKYIFGILFFMPVASYSLDLPKEIEDALSLNQRQGVCQAEWRDLADKYGVKKHQLESGYQLTLVPCSHWAVNTQYMAFLTLEEVTAENQDLHQTLFFLTYTPYKRVHPTNTVAGVYWDQEARRLRSKRYFDSTGKCGAEIAYSWNKAQQIFEAEKMLKHDDCLRPSEKWEFVHLPY